MLRHEIYVADAEQGTFRIKVARKAALEDPLYTADLFPPRTTQRTTESA